VDHSINHISLCSGYAGIDLGLERVLPGCRTIASVEIEAFACANLVSKMEAGQLDPHPVWTDLHTFPFRQFHGLVDIISAGFPCQPFSQAGARRGVEDKRHLWPRIAEGIRRSRPAMVFMENVDGIATARSPEYESVLHHVLSDLEGLGFRATAGLYTASEVGAPHQRKRWFILGVANARRLDREVPIERIISAVEKPRGHGTPGRTWPAGPDEDRQPGEPSRTIEPDMGGGPDGSASGVDPALHRVDRLRLLGNGVVPDQAALAFHELFSELTSTITSTS
jgi:DNA (cytosine-5)-methyltransferase 1